MHITKEELKQQILSYHKMIEQHKNNLALVETQSLLKLAEAARVCEENINRELRDLEYLKQQTEEEFPELWI